MRKSLVLLALSLTVVSCNKATNDFIWEKSFGPGNAFFLRSSADSGIVSCGTINDNPYLLKLTKDKKTEVEFTSERKGLFNSVWFDTSRFITGGNNEGKMLLACIDNDGSKVWDTVLTASFKVELTSLSYSGSGNLVAAGTAIPDSAVSGSAGIFFVKFDTTGQIIEKKTITETGFVAANKITSDGSGNIFLPLTRRKTGAKSQASVAKYTAEFNKIWETELYTNPDFGAAALGIILDGQRNIYVSGETELSAEESVLYNSFLVSLTSSGSIRWKKYLEKSNAGTALIFDDNEVLMMLNTNCFLINMADPDDGSDAGRIRMFDICDSKDTDAFGKDLDLNYDGNLLVAGSKGGNYYLALKSLMQ